MLGEPPPIVVFCPDLLLGVTIEARSGGDDLHLHPAGQGVWVARMAAELGAWPILCGLAGGESGSVLSGLLASLPGERRLTVTAGASGSYVADRRGADRELVAASLRPPPQRHELDDLVAATCAAALGSRALVLCIPFPADGLPAELYARIAADVSQAGVPVLVDLSTPRLDQTLVHGPALVKLNDWELAEYVRGPVDGRHGLEAARRLQAAGAQAVVVTRAEGPILVLAGDDDPFELVPPTFTQGFREGCGDSMMGAIAAAWARGLPLREALVLGAAAGAGNYLRHGIGTGRREVVEQLATHVVARPWTGDASPMVQTAG